MTTEARIPATEVTGILGSVMKTMSKRMLGKVPDSVGVMWHNRRVLLDLSRIGRKSEKWDALDTNLSSLARMATAACVGCSFCLDLHYFLAHDQGLDEAKAREVPRWREASVFSPLERKVMEYAEAMCQMPPAVSDELSAELLDALGPAALLELTAKVGLMDATARMNIALGIHSDGLSDSCGLRPLAARSPQRVSSPA
ncbi:carboxymuconolactone decarboxylase family protein [Agromyces aerolatus]|uniref:carboxymuconolactone decarboxylase family protein n=1 Tax=Agromyces sp. LY-1074 TaxID=3074080 RepID=UPI0028608E1A|nr:MULTISPECIES: carboxymuconolactone decarboxylase family protein [unclassified Agromyces]MDR5699610.1 carboxymuconolactone decarboxylase family protein [Agromyces sp. LY-1074]MDR5705906.1 carboxymuconolactone decarboxylase family protein [Agromyces sp. LY-1358]